MDEIRTGVFEISTKVNEFWTDWQLELAKEDLRRRARTAMQKIQREGVHYTTCLYPPFEDNGNLVLSGFCLLARWEDCEIGEACYVTLESDIDDAIMLKRDYQKESIYIYRRIL